MNGFSVYIPYTPTTHQGHSVNPTVSQWVIYTEAAGFQWNTLSCTQEEALNKRDNQTPSDQIAEIKFQAV